MIESDAAEKAAALAVWFAERGTPCSEAAFAAVDRALDLGLAPELRAAASIFHHGAGTEDRCGIFEAGVLLIGWLYGRLEPDLSHQGDRYLAEKLYESFQNAYGSYFCADVADGTHVCVLREAVPWIVRILMNGETLMLEAPTGPKPTAVSQSAVAVTKKDQLKTFFFVHESLWDFADCIVTEDDWLLIASAGADRRVDTAKYPTEFLIRKYRQGFLMKDPAGDPEDEKASYIVGGFAARIDCCMRGEREFWNALPQTVRNAYVGYLQDVDIWAVPYYLKGHTDDVMRVIPFEEAVKVVKNVPGDYAFSVKECDCRIYNGYVCDHPIDVCLHWKKQPEINTSLDRGYARPISKEAAIGVLRNAYESGLIHSYGESLGGFCNCCVCCCWAFKNMDKLRAKGYNPREIWYRTDYVIAVDEEKCVNCGLCAKRCGFAALKKGESAIEADEEKCWGCGACRPVCPKDALSVRQR
ncbi:MAG: C-GCAxxG-C-C family protein [Clostridiales Family XIII bacterium]|nr:C-GCAxxG-C-C family protein [Clostridiales Family XIII bacterium]